MSGGERRNMVASMLVIGIGNAYRSDDGVGPAVACALQTKNLPCVQCKEDLGDTLSLIEQWDTADTVILIDAVCSGAEPGTIYRFDALAQPIPTSIPLRSTHFLSLAEALSIADILHRLPSRLIVYGIEGENFSAGIDLSPQVKNALYEVVERVEHECRSRSSCPLFPPCEGSTDC